ncbi:Acyl-CoA Delta(11) desaturase [Temnothorax longispinosus]|uniref:Acyl-CoA Delta(11) desaturase n=1 Tax=Temnothorax longispinosus TaxID=300112 RepID=A0A4S2KT80_9HYME|nr:Acyl-CoA Delta(11) desaturase [Temnothorax longispinosus]
MTYDLSDECTWVSSRLPSQACFIISVKEIREFIVDKIRINVVREIKLINFINISLLFFAINVCFIKQKKLIWLDLIAQIFIHGGCLYGLYLVFTQAKLLTPLWAFATIYTSGFGITAGVHRLWSHKAYKAKWPLRLLLVLLFTITGQTAHVGWLFTTPHPDVVAKRKAVDVSDLEADSIVMYYIPLFALLTIALPVAIPCYLWSESLWVSFWVNFNLRFCINLNIAFSVNSVAHMWGQKPYDKYISPVENIAVSIASLGEGYHNYHHVFPWDYKTGELGDYPFNLTTGFIDLFARIGWAYDLKYVSPNMIRRRARRCGDGSHVWGYGDVDISKEDLTELDMMELFVTYNIIINFTTYNVRKWYLKFILFLTI